MKKGILFIVIIVLFSMCKKNSDKSPSVMTLPQSGDTLSSSKLQILESATLDSITIFTDLLFPDGSNISKWDLANGSGNSHAFNRGTSILSASDKKRQFIDLMSKAGLYLANDKQCTCYPQQPYGLAYVYGSHSILSPSRSNPGICQQLLFGLDCSGMIYEMAYSSNINISYHNTKEFVDVGIWNNAFKNTPDFAGLEMQDLSFLPPSQFEAGDIIIEPGEHMAMVYRTGTTLGIMNSQGSPSYNCEKNSGEGRGPVLRADIEKFIGQLFPKNDYHILRVMQNGTPGLTTISVSSLSQKSALSGGNITNDGGAVITARGVCWDTIPNPKMTKSKTSDGTGTGTFKSSLTGLTPNTIYYLRAYATNSAGTSYGNNISFSTLSNNNDSTTGQPSKDSHCKENGTGDFCFQNNTGLDLELTLSSSPSKVQSYTPPYTATLKPGQKQCFFGVPAGPAGYEIKTPATYNGYGNQSQPETYLATGYVYVDQCRENTFFINTGSPSYSTNDLVFSGGNTNATSKDLNCKGNETADFYFQNSTDMELNVTLMTSPSKQYNYTPPYLCIIQPGQQQGFFNVPAGPATYEIKTPATYTGGSGNSPDTYFVKGSLYVDQCKGNIFVIKK